MARISRKPARRCKHCNKRITVLRECEACRTRIKRQRHKVRCTWQSLKDNAKRRGKEFTLTLEQFTVFCYETKYIAGKGRGKKHLTIDRIDNDKGYTIDNIRVLTRSENSSKGTRLIYDYRDGFATHVKE